MPSDAIWSLGGWTLVTSTDRWTDVEAVRGDERLIAEVKGRTQEKGVDADIAYGQLLRRMTTGSPQVRYALVVPTTALWHARRVPARVRELLRIDLYEVTDDGRVDHHPT